MADETPTVIEACPFCAHRPELRVGKFPVAPIKRFMLGCVNEMCEMWVRTKFCATLKEAIDTWNHRVTLDAPAEAVVSSGSSTPV